MGMVTLGTSLIGVKFEFDRRFGYNPAPTGERFRRLCRQAEGQYIMSLIAWMFHILFKNKYLATKATLIFYNSFEDLACPKTKEKKGSLPSFDIRGTWHSATVLKKSGESGRKIQSPSALSDMSEGANEYYSAVCLYNPFFDFGPNYYFVEVRCM